MAFKQVLPWHPIILDLLPLIRSSMSGSSLGLYAAPEMCLLGTANYSVQVFRLSPYFCIRIFSRPVCFWVIAWLIADPMEKALSDVVSKTDNAPICNPSSPWDLCMTRQNGRGQGDHPGVSAKEWLQGQCNKQGWNWFKQKQRIFLLPPSKPLVVLSPIYLCVFKFRSRFEFKTTDSSFVPFYPLKFQAVCWLEQWSYWSGVVISNLEEAQIYM